MLRGMSVRHFNYTLTPTRINNTKPKDHAYRLMDGGALFFMVMLGGAPATRLPSDNRPPQCSRS
ncbi:hypothetical protein RSP816_03730 [Ralstonia solanacearum]|nr:hypothetical protein RSP816_03730 [Ralstonia solanacearum]RIJ86030.1 hypothetical protein RSP822_12635 [Ralstonia solanacearum]